MKYWILEFKNQTKKIFVILLCGASNVRSECQTQLRWTAHHIVQMNHGNNSNIVEEMKIYANFSYMLTLIGFLFQCFFSKKMKPVVFFHVMVFTVFTQKSKLASSSWRWAIGPIWLSQVCYHSNPKKEWLV